MFFCVPFSELAFIVDWILNAAPEEHFAILEPPNQDIGELCVEQKWRSTDFEALNL